MKTLLAAIDLEPESALVVKKAAELAVQLKASLHLVHVVDDALTLYEPLVEIPVRHRLKQAAETALGAFFDALPGAVKPDGGRHVVLGKPARALVKKAAELNADLIIVGKHHMDPMRDLFLGTTAERLLRHCDLPLLMVNTDTTQPYQQVLAGSDFSRSSHHALQAGLWLAPQAQVRLVHVFDPPFMGFVRHDQLDVDTLMDHQRLRIEQEVKTEMAHFLADDDQSRITTEIMAGETQVCLAQAVEKHKPQLLVLGTHGRQGISRLLIGSVAMSFLSMPPCDVLVAR
ncbi:universal stress protein [Zobellella sp. DQSA1]|uniref:universal stress protein n=1 Tax=Zobellella sp. DQSA1 TaxID=3342386 RepID=UPI0035C158DC